MPQILEAIGILLIAFGVMALLLGLGRGLAGMVRRPRRALAPEPTVEREGPKVAGLEETARRVLSVIQAHSEGIRLVEIGEELGVNWRLLIVHVNDLLQRGLIRKEDRKYYPL